LGVSDDSTVVNVAFYRESNGIAGLQFGSAGDTLLAVDSNGADGWSLVASTAGLTNGSYTYYAQPADDDDLVGAPASTTNTVIGAANPLTVNSSILEFEARQAVSITFNNPLNPATVSTTDLAALNLSNASTPVASSVILSAGNTVATWVFSSPGSPISDGNYQFTLAAGAVSDLNGNSLSAQHQLSGPTVFYLGGDTNRDRKIDVADLGILATNWQQSPRTFSQGDFDYTGTVDVNDLGILATKWQQSLASSPPGARSAPVRSRPIRGIIDELNPPSKVIGSF
jgi:hypothetical protein